MTPTQSIVWILEGYEREPFMMVRHCHPHWGCVHNIPEMLSYKRLARLKEAGFVIDDPDGLVTCHCGEFKYWTRMECDACAGEHADHLDDVKMYDSLRYGG